MEPQNDSPFTKKDKEPVYQLPDPTVGAYVDDILLFSKDEESHAKLLAEFYNLVKSQGIMLSEKKMVIGQSSIDFLGVNISDGKYTLQPHIASSLAEFPDKLTNTKQTNSSLEL